MSRIGQEVTDAELSVLQALWDGPASTIRQLVEVVYPDGTASHYATVQKLLERLEGKEFVQRDRSASVHTFSATVGRDELIGRRLRSVAEKLCGGSMTPLLTHLVTTENLSRQERDDLRALIDELDQSKRKSPPK